MKAEALVEERLQSLVPFGDGSTEIERAFGCHRTASRVSDLPGARIASVWAMNERRLEQAAEKLRNGRRRTIECGALAAMTFIGAIAAAPLSTHLALIFAACAATETLLALVSRLSRRELIGRLALDPAAYVLPEVRRYGEESAQPHQRERLAAWLADLPALSTLPGSIYLGDRIEEAAADLEWLARELATPSVQIEAASAVACRRLLTDAVGSALYNPRVPEDDLHATLRRIRFGISRTHSGDGTIPTRQ